MTMDEIEAPSSFLSDKNGLPCLKRRFYNVVILFTLYETEC